MKIYIVFNPQGNAPKMMHDTKESAMREAERLAGANAGQEFHVMESLGFWKTGGVAFTGFPQEDSEGWIEWSGGQCPVVPAGARLEVVLRGGSRHITHSSHFRWNHSGSNSDIICYRVVR